jgi:N-acetylglucosaminyldiphosphoundecaprenol N-acetyl-beta-D-mannosaminyltransferase
MKQVNLFGINIASLTDEEFEKEIQKAVKGSKQVRNGKVNSEFLVRAIEDSGFKTCLADFDLNIADGIGVLWAGRYLSIPLSSTPGFRQLQAIWQMIYSGASLVFAPSFCRNSIVTSFPGQDCFYQTLKAVEKEDKGIYLFGARKEVLDNTITTIKENFPKLKIVGWHDGYSDKSQKVIDDINKSKAEVLFVGLGSPEQEYWIRDNIKELKSVRLAVGEGGTFDFIGGRARRAPKMIKKWGLEWLWRLFFSKNLTTGAGRRTKRVWRAVPIFIYKTIVYKLENR